MYVLTDVSLALALAATSGVGNMLFLGRVRCLVVVLCSRTAKQRRRLDKGIMK